MKTTLEAARIGQSNIMSNGQSCSVAAYRNSSDIDVVFEDGTVKEHATWQNFRKGTILNPNLRAGSKRQAREGTTKAMANGQACTCIRYISANDITVQFEDGYIREHASWRKFMLGCIRNPNVSFADYHPEGKQRVRKQAQERIGITKRMKNGLPCTVTGYRSATDMDATFGDGLVREHITWENFRKGSVKHPGIRPRTAVQDTQEYLKQERECMEKPMNNGLPCKITEYRRNDDITVRFADGVERTASYRAFRLGTVDHPGLSLTRAGSWMGFDCLTAHENHGKPVRVDGIPLYLARCTVCGYEDVLTPREMMEHAGIHNKE